MLAMLSLTVLRGGEASRIWTSRGGSSFQGTLVRAGAETVTLRSVDGRDVEVPLSALSEVDQAYVMAQRVREDHYAQRRHRLVELAPESGAFLGPMFQEGIWKGAMFVFVHDHYTYVMDGGLEGVLYPVTAGEKAVDAGIEAMTPLFAKRNPQASDRKERGWNALRMTGITSGGDLPVMLRPSVRGTAEITLQVTLSNQKVCEVRYSFSGEGIQIYVRYPDFESEEELGRVQIRNEFPAVPETQPDWDFDQIKAVMAPWRLDWKDAVSGKEPLGSGGLAWWDAGNGLLCRELRVDGPWEPWTFTFTDTGKGNPQMSLGIYPAMSLYRRKFTVSRFAAPSDGDLEIEWMFRFEK